MLALGRLRRGRVAWCTAARAVRSYGMKRLRNDHSGDRMFENKLLLVIGFQNH